MGVTLAYLNGSNPAAGGSAAVASEAAQVGGKIQTVVSVNSAVVGIAAEKIQK